MKTKSKEPVLIFIFILATLFLYIPEIMFFSKGFLGGDYGQQFYPYSVLYAKAIKHFHFNFFTDLIGCGYNLLAEGQTGFFYPLNLLLFFLLPVKMAYQFNTIIHFILGGLFSYIFIRNKGVSKYSGFIFSLVFMFGANVCGINYNTVVQKVWVWFPLGLYFTDKFFSTNKNRYIFLLFAVFILQVFAGFLQIAAYAIGFSLVYFLIKLFQAKTNNTKKTFGFLFVGLCVFALISSLQILPVLRQVGTSTRAMQDSGFSLWGSMNPIAIFTLIFPKWDSVFGGNLYMGVGLLLFFLLFLHYYKKAPFDIKIYFYLAIFSLVLALGKFTPLLPVLIKLFHLNFIRKPSKFLFITNFFLSLTAIWSLDYFLKAKPQKEKIILMKSVKIIILTVIVAFAIANITFVFGKSHIMNLAKGFIKENIYGKSFHRYDLQFYYIKLNSLFNNIQAAFSFTNGYNLTGIILLLIALAVFRIKKYFKPAFFIFVFIDLFIFNQHSTGLKGNLINWAKYAKKPAYIEFLQKDKADFRIYNFITKDTEHYFYENYKLLANKNLIYKIPSIGIYAPIINKNYYSLLGDLGAVDDSLGRIPANKDILRNNIGLLKFLGVRYIISFKKLDSIRGLKLIYNEGRMYIYQLDNFPFVFFARAVKFFVNKDDLLKEIKNAGYNPQKFVAVRGKRYGEFRSIGFPKDWFIRKRLSYPKLTLEVKADRKSFLVIGYSGRYNIYIDNKKAGIYQVNLVYKGIIVPRGKHLITVSNVLFN